MIAASVTTGKWHFHHNPIQVTFPLIQSSYPAHNPPQMSAYLKWTPNQEPNYSEDICTHLVNHPIHSAIKNRDVDRAYQALIDLIRCSAEATNMLTRPVCRKRQPAGKNALPGLMSNVERLNGG